MNLSDLLKESFLALTANKARTGLTMLGIVIGIGSVIAMVSVGQGASGQIQEKIQSLGSNLITVSPGFASGFSGDTRGGRGSATTLTTEDALSIVEEVPSVAAVAPMLSKKYQIVQKSLNTNTDVVGTVETYLQVKNIEMEIGAFISEKNYTSLSKVAVLGATTRDDLFGEDANPIGKTIKINSITFKVIGVTKAKGGSGFTNQDDMVFIPLSTAQKILAGSEYISSIAVQASEENAMTQVQEDITQLLLTRHNVDSESADFSVINQADIVDTATETTDTFTALLAAIASISLLVGGIGIMNMMLTTVTERTREIGLRKAIGAKKKDIQLQFLSEVVILTFIGGGIGVALGIAIAYSITYFTSTATEILPSSIILAFGVSATIGIVFGYYPAWKAAQLNPIEALRYE